MLQEYLIQFDSKILVYSYTIASKEFSLEIDKVLMLPIFLMILIMNFSSSSLLFLIMIYNLLYINSSDI